MHILYLISFSYVSPILEQGQQPVGSKSAANIDKPNISILFDFVKQICKNRQTKSYHKVLTALLDATMPGITPSQGDC
jgi:hypothetical protein